MRYAVGVCRYGVSLGSAGAGWLVLEGVAFEGVSGAVSVRADMGVLCLLDERRSRALALPVPFLDAGAMIGFWRWIRGLVCKGLSCRKHRRRKGVSRRCR